MCSIYHGCVNWLNGKVIRRDFSCISYTDNISDRSAFQVPFLIIAAFLPPNRHSICRVHVWFTISIQTELIRSNCKSGWNSFVYLNSVPFVAIFPSKLEWFTFFASISSPSPPLNTLLLECTLHINMHKNRTKANTQSDVLTMIQTFTQNSQKTHSSMAFSYYLTFILHFSMRHNRLWIYHCENKNTSKSKRTQTHGVYIVLRLWI